MSAPSELSAGTTPKTKEPARLLHAFRSSDPAEREQAIAVAARYLEPHMLGPLLAESAEANVRNAALEALVRQGPYARDYLRELAEGEDPEVAMFCVQALSRLPDPNSAPILVMLLRHEDDNVVLSAIEALGLLRAGEAVPALLELLEGDDLWRRFGAVRALGQIGDPRALPAVLEFTHDEMLREPAIEALGGFGSPDCLQALLDLLASADSDVARDRTLKAMGNILTRLEEAHDPTARVLLEDWKPNAETAVYLERTIGMPDAEMARAAGLLALLCRFDSLYAALVRRASNAEELGWVRELFHTLSTRARPALPGLFRHRDRTVRACAADVAQLDDELAGRLVESMNDPDGTVRQAAYRALGRAGYAPAIAPLLERLGSSDDAEREAAAEALAGMPVERLDGLARYLEPGSPAPAVLAALRVVRDLADDRWLEPALSWCGAQNAAVRAAAVQAAGALPGVRLREDLLPLLDDAVEEVRIEVAEILIRRPGDDSIEALLGLLERDDQTRYHAIRGLGQMRAHVAADRLRTLYATAQPHEQLGILSALIRLAPPWIFEFLEARFERGDGDTRRTAAEGLARFADETRLERLISMAEDDDWSVRAYAAQALGRLSDCSAERVLLDLARDVEPIVAQTAREVLGHGQ